MASRQYAAILFRGEEGFGVAFPDLPGCVSYGLTVQEAASQAEIALAGHIGLLVRDGDPLPEPTPLDRIDDKFIDPEDEEAGRMLVRVEIPNRSVRINLSMAETLVARIDQAARELGMSRSGYLAEAARRMLSMA